MCLIPKPKDIVTLVINLWFMNRFWHVHALAETVRDSVCFEECTFFLRWKLIMSDS